MVFGDRPLRRKREFYQFFARGSAEFWGVIYRANVVRSRRRARICEDKEKCCGSWNGQTKVCTWKLKQNLDVERWLSGLIATMGAINGKQKFPGSPKPHNFLLEALPSFGAPEMWCGLNEVKEHAFPGKRRNALQAGAFKMKFWMRKLEEHFDVERWLSG